MREVLQARWTIKSLGLVKLICLLTPHGKGYFVCAKPKVVGVQWSKCVQCSVECIVYILCLVCSVRSVKQNKFTFSEMVVLPDSFSACYTLLATVGICARALVVITHMGGSQAKQRIQKFTFPKLISLSCISVTGEPSYAHNSLTNKF